jgi:hypothetical protein
MALVIFCVALVAAMRTRMSLRLGMYQIRTAERRTIDNASARVR